MPQIRILFLSFCFTYAINIVYLITKYRFGNPKLTDTELFLHFKWEIIGIVIMAIACKLLERTYNKLYNNENKN